MTPLRRFGVILLCVLAALLLLAAGLWLARAPIAARVAQAYFRAHGIQSDVEIGKLGYSGVTGRFALGPKDAPELSAERLELQFDPLSWTPRIVSVRLVKPVVRARVGEDGKVTLPALQSWIQSLSGNGGDSRFVADDLALSLSGLRAILATPGGVLDLSGDVRLVKNDLVFAALTARPGAVAHSGVTVQIAAASLRLEKAEDAYNVSARFKGALRMAALQASDVTAQIGADAARWDLARQSFSVPSLRLEASGDFKSAMLEAQGATLSVAADSVSAEAQTRNLASRSARIDIVARELQSAGIAAATPKLDVILDYLRLTSQPDGRIQGNADLRLSGGAGFDSAPLLRAFPVLARDPKLANAIRANLRRLDLDMNGALRMAADGARFAIEPSARLRGAGGAVLEAKTLAFDPFAPLRFVDADMTLRGSGLPAIAWQGALKSRNGGLEGGMAVRVRGDYDMLRGGDLSAKGHIIVRDGRYSFALQDCARIALAAFHPGDSELARDIAGLVCPAGGGELLSGDAKGWRLTADSRAVTAFLPLATSRLDNASGPIAFSGDARDFGGKLSISGAKLTDNAPVRRFNPLMGAGDIVLASGIWRGAFKVSDPDRNSLGTVNFTHTMATGSGEAHIAAPRLQFAPDKLQPAMLSPLLGPVKQAQGTARFEGRVAWTRDGIDSSGTLGIQKLDFLTPLGTAHAIEADIALVSLLPPQTAPDQHIAISRIDWTLPLTGIALDLSFSPDSVRIEAAKAGIAEGEARLGALSVNLAGARRADGTARLEGIALAPLVTATNLGSKIRLEGKVTGTIPFTVGPEGFRIANGRLASDGPGRISLDRSLWGEAAQTANSVQDLAYQALEYLAFDSLTAEVNSVAQGRLQIVFHIKGRSDPPKPQQAEIRLGDVLDGTVMQKPIALPSGTPIDLTLDTSLNFDELLKSYADAWSKSLGAP